MPALQERYLTACDFDDVALYDPKSVRSSKKGADTSDHTLRMSQGSPASMASSSSRSSSKDLSGTASAMPSIDPHSSFQSIGSNVSTPTLASDTSSLRSSLSSISSPTLVNPHTSHFAQSNAEKAPPMPANPTALSSGGRRKSVPVLVDNTSMASLTHLPSFRTQHRAYSSRSRKQRELDFETDEGDDIWPGDGLMFNVPMSPALYAQQKQQQKQQHSVDVVGREQPRVGRMPLANQQRRGSHSSVPRNKSLPAIHEQRSERSMRRFSESQGVRQNFSFAGPSNTGSLAASRSTSVASIDFMRNSTSADSSIDGLDPDASSLTLELYRLEEEQEQQRRRRSDASSAHPGAITPRTSTEDGEDMLPMPHRKHSDDSELGSGDSRRSSLTRPENLPPKSPEEERKHLKEYEKLMKDAITAEKRKQQKREEESKRRAHQEKIDEGIWSAWIAKKCKSRPSSDLRWRGVPHHVRGNVWLAQTNADISTLPAPALIKQTEITQDSEYVWPECGIFGPDRPLHDALIRVIQRFLAAYPEIEYQFSLASIAGLLLLHLEECESAAVMIKLVTPGSLVHSVLTNNEQLASANYVSFMKVYRTKFERLSQHFAKVGITVSDFMNPLVAGIFSTVLPTPELAARILDVYIFEGDSFLLRAGLGLLRTNEAWLYVSKEEALEHLEDPRVSSDDTFMQAVHDVTRP